LGGGLHESVVLMAHAESGLKTHPFEIESHTINDCGRLEKDLQKILRRLPCIISCLLKAQAPVGVAQARSKSNAVRKRIS